MTSEVIIVESHNNSYEDNTTSSFKVRLPRELVFNLPHQIGLVDVAIPNTIFNIQPNNFFILSIFTDHTTDTEKLSKSNRDHEKLLKDTSSKEGRTHPYRSPAFLDTASAKLDLPSKFPKVTKTLNPLAQKVLKSTKPLKLLQAQVKMTVKASIHPGFYSDIKKLLGEISTAVFRVVKDQNLRRIKVPTVDEVRGNHFFKSGREGWFVCEELGNYNEKLKKIYLDFSLNRISFRNSMGMVCFKPPKNIDLINTVSYHFSEDIGLVWGFPPTQSRVLLSPTLKTVQYAPNLARIQAEDTIYLYCPQVRNSIVSNFEVPILRCLPFSSRKLGFGDIYFQEFVNQVYHDLSPQRLYNLEFELRNNRGQLIQFEGGSKPVRLTLKIKPKQSY